MEARSRWASYVSTASVRTCSTPADRLMFTCLSSSTVKWKYHPRLSRWWSGCHQKPKDGPLSRQRQKDYRRQSIIAISTPKVLP